MADDAWLHWAQGRGEKSVRDVILEEIDQIRKSTQDEIKRWAAVAPEDLGEHDVGRATQHKIEIQLPAGDWAEACQRVGSVSTSQLLAALILESKSWRQVGNADTEHNAGWNQDSLVSSLGSLTATTAGLSLGRDEKILALMVAVGAVVGGLAAVASAVAAWWNP